MTGMDVGYDRPPGLLQHGDEAARGFPGIATALRGPDHDPGDLGRACRGTARRQGRLHCSCHRPGSADAQHPVAPQLVTTG